MLECWQTTTTTMDIKDPEPEDLALLVKLDAVVRLALDLNMPSEDVHPGATSLAVAVLVRVAGELIRGAPQDDQAGMVAHYQLQLAEACHEHRTDVH